MTAPRKRAPGAGRKPLAPDDPTERQDVTMPASYWAKARTLGDGNASAGIRVALDRAVRAASVIQRIGAEQYERDTKR